MEDYVSALEPDEFADYVATIRRLEGAFGPADMALNPGEKRYRDKAVKKITLKHGPIPNLDMPGMTMVFQVSDPAILELVKAGDKVKFAADKVGDNYVVTKIEPAR